MTDDKGEISPLTQQDIKPHVKPSDLTRLRIGRELARLTYLDGYTQQQAILKVLPHITKESALKHSTRIFGQYNVINCLFDLLPKELSPTEFEGNFHYLKKRAIERGDDKLLLALLDISAKATGKYKTDINLNVSKDDEYIQRVERARKIIEEQGIDITQVDKA